MSSNLTSELAEDYFRKYVNLYYQFAGTSFENLKRYIVVVVTILLDLLLLQICWISTTIIIVSNNTQIYSKMS